MEGVILSSWDHIMGPQIEKLWLMSGPEGKNFCEFSSDILRDFNLTKRNKHSLDDTISQSSAALHNSMLPDMQSYSIMCGQLLLGEVDSCKPAEEWVSRFYISDSHILSTVVFHMNSSICLVNESTKKRDVCFCLGIIFKHKALKFALDNQYVIDLHLRKAVDLMQNSKIPLEILMKKIHVIVEDLASLLETLRTSHLNNVQSHQFPSFQEFTQSDLMSKAIVSHLQTSGYTAVIGISNLLINQVIFVLSLFSPPEECRCSLLVPDFAPNSYIEGIYIQGAVKDMNMDYKYLLERAFRDSLSLTIVDTNLSKVWQAVTVHNTANNYRNTSTQVIETGHLIPQLLKDLYFIQKNGGDCRILVENFYKHLMVQAASLIKAIEPLRNAQNDLTAKDIMKMFAIDNIVDLAILFGCAEKLKPGFRSIIS